jgi:hypothetical protein
MPMQHLIPRSPNSNAKPHSSLVSTQSRSMENTTLSLAQAASMPCTQGAGEQLAMKDNGSDERNVLLGRGKKYAHHPGNMLFHGTILRASGHPGPRGLLFPHYCSFLNAELLNDNMAEYFAPTTTPLEKRIILQKIVQSVYQQHGRFMKRDGGTGVRVPISKEEAAVKTATALQYRARKQSSRSPPVKTCVVNVKTPHSKSSQVPLDIFVPHLPRAIHVSPPVHAQRLIVVIPRSIRISRSTTSCRCLPHSIPTTKEFYARYRYLRERYNEVNPHCSAERIAASNTMQPRGYTGFFPAHPERALYQTLTCDSDAECISGTSGIDRHSNHDAAVAVWQRTLSVPCPYSVLAESSFWEPLPLLDSLSTMGQSLVHDPNDPLSELSESALNASFDANEPLDLSQLLDL